VPDSNTVVNVSTPVPNYPLVSSIATCKSLTTSPGVSVQIVSGFKLNIVGHN